MVLDNKVKPFVSSEDIGKGDRGLNKIADQLEQSSFGIVVVTPSNQNSPWINFEAGALGKSVTDGMVAPLLVGLTDSDVKGPIKQFQNSEASDKHAVFSLVKSLNGALLKEGLGDGTVNVLFKEHWPQLEAAIKNAPDDDAASAKKPRAESDLLDEVLTTVRSLQRDVARLQKLMEHSTGTVQGDKELYKDVSRLLIRDLNVSSVSGASLESGDLRISLADEAGAVPESTLNDLQNFAERYGKSIIVRTTSGAPVSFVTGGKEMETARLVVNPLI